MAQVTIQQDLRVPAVRSLNIQQGLCRIDLDQNRRYHPGLAARSKHIQLGFSQR